MGWSGALCSKNERRRVVFVMSYDRSNICNNDLWKMRVKNRERRGGKREEMGQRCSRATGVPETPKEAAGD